MKYNVKIIQGDLSGETQRFGIVVARFNTIITERLLKGALDCLERHAVPAESVTVCYVPGSFEIPFAARMLAEKADIDAVICLGAVIRGHTDHYHHVANGVASGVAELSRTCGKPVIFGVLTTESLEHAILRAGAKGGNQGWDAALSAIEMVNVARALTQN